MNIPSVGCLRSGLKLKFCRDGTSLAVDSQQGNLILLSQGVTGTGKSGGFHKLEKVPCVLMSQCVWYNFPQQGLPQHTPTHSLEVWGWGHSYGNALKKGRHICRVLVRKGWLPSATGWGYLRDLHLRLHPLSVTPVENKLELCWSYDSGAFVLC